MGDRPLVASVKLEQVNVGDRPLVASVKLEQVKFGRSGINIEP